MAGSTGCGLSTCAGVATGCAAGAGWAGVTRGFVSASAALARGEGARPAVLAASSDGSAQVLAQAPPGAVQAIAVTIEPEGGVPAPTGDKVLLGLPAVN